MAGLVRNLVDTILTGVKSVATEIVAQHLRRDNIRILIEYQMCIRDRFDRPPWLKANDRHSGSASQITLAV